MLARFIRTFGGIGFKIGLFLVLLAALTVVAIMTGLGLSGQITRHLDAFKVGEVPHLRESAHIAERVSEVGEGMSTLLIAGESTVIDEAGKALQGALDELAEALEDEPVADGLDPMALLDTMRAALVELGDLRRRELAEDSLTLSESDALGMAIGAAKARLSAIWAQEMATARGDSSVSALKKMIALERMSEAAQLERQLGAFQTAILTGASADDVEGVTQARRDAETLEANIRLHAASFAGDETLDPAIAEVLSKLDPEVGILAARDSVVRLRAEAEAVSTRAAEALAATNGYARKLAERAVEQIDRASTELLVKARDGNASMWSVAIGSAIILAVSPVALHFLVVGPIRRISAVTIELANGATGEVPSFSHHGGEIATLGDALGIFRRNRLERLRLMEEERTREETRREEQVQRDRDAQERERRERERELAAEAAEREREAEAAREREAMRERAEVERRARQAEQDGVVRELAAGLSALANGDLSAHIGTVFPEAYEDLRANFNLALSNLSHLISQITDAADQISGNSHEISAAANDLSRRTEHSAATLEETAAALNELTASVEMAADGARQADGQSRAANAKAEDSRNVVRDAMGAMAEIEESSNKISKIIDVIDDIAFQTNLLALNAGVEAARAGDAGRGFAVVASEVRALAQRSSEAAREINALISNSTDQIQRGVRLVDHTGQVLQEIISAVADIAGNVASIASSAQEQAIGIKEINAATAQLENTMQQNAAMTEETTAASMVLSKAAEDLQKIAQTFRTGSDPARGHYSRTAA